MNVQRLVIIATTIVAVLAVAALIIVPRLGGGASAAGTDLALDAQPRMGADDAGVEVVLFEDFLCPHCATFTETVMPRLERDYEASGEAAFYFVNFVVMGPESERIAAVGECVAEQDRDAFWDFEEVAFRSQGTLDEARAIDLASEYVDGLDEEALRSCIDDGTGMEAVRSDVGIAQDLGLGGTPAVLVDGEEVTASYDGIAAAIDAAAE